MNLSSLYEIIDRENIEVNSYKMKNDKARIK